MYILAVVVKRVFITNIGAHPFGYIHCWIPNFPSLFFKKTKILITRPICTSWFTLVNAWLLEHRCPSTYHRLPNPKQTLSFIFQPYPPSYQVTLKCNLYPTRRSVNHHRLLHVSFSRCHSICRSRLVGRWPCVYLNTSSEYWWACDKAPKTGPLQFTENDFKLWSGCIHKNSAVHAASLVYSVIHSNSFFYLFIPSLF